VAGPSGAGIDMVRSDVGGVDIEVTVSLEVDTVVEDGAQHVRLSVDGWPTTADPGSPEVPYVVVPLVVPPSGSVRAAVIARVDTAARVGAIVAMGRADIPVGDPIVPAPRPAALVRSPTETISVSIVGTARDVRLARLVIRPVRASGNLVTWAKRLSIAVRFTEPPATDRIAQGRLGRTRAAHPAASAINSESIDAFRRPRTRRARRVASRQTSWSGPRVRLYIAYEGMYRVTGSDLLKWGEPDSLDFRAVDPGTFRLEHRGHEVPIHIDGEGRGFDETMAIEFYAKPNTQRYMSVAPDSYSDPFVETGVYWLSWGDRPGLRFAEESAAAETDTVEIFPAHKYRHTVHAEKDLRYAHLEKALSRFADRYFWKQVRSGVTQSFEVDLPHPVPNAQAGPSFEIVARGASAGEHELEYKFGDANLEASAVATNGEFSGTDAKLIHTRVDTDPLLVGVAPGTNALEVTLSYQTKADGTGKIIDYMLLNWFDVTYERYYHTDENTLIFRRPKQIERGHIDFTVTGFTSPDIKVYKVGQSMLTNFDVGLTPASAALGAEGYEVRFRDSLGTQDPLYIALTEERMLTPEEVEVAMPWQLPLRETSRRGEYLIVAHPLLVDTVATLADYRRSPEGGGYGVSVVDVQQIYDEFDDGYPTASAIYEFLRYAYENWDEPPLYVVMVGDAVDKFTGPGGEFRGRWIFSGSALLPVPQVSVLGWGATGSDYGFSVMSDDDGLPDIFIGRIPATNGTQLGIAIRKTIRFEQSPDLTPWRNSITMVSGQRDLFVVQCEELINEVPAWYEIAKLYNNVTVPVDAFYGSRTEIVPLLDQGSMWTIFIGHAGGKVWTVDELLRFGDAEMMQNAGRTGIFLSMTCFTGAYDVPGVESLAEEMVLAPNGAAAWFGATGTGWLYNDFYLTQSLLRLGLPPGGEARTLGYIVAAGKADYALRFGGMSDEQTYVHAMVHEFNLIGDPALRVDPPSPDVVLTAVPRTPIRGGTVELSGSLPAGSSVSGTARVRLYDELRHLLFEDAAVPVVNGSFQVPGPVQLPSDSDDRSLIFNAYVSANGPDGRDWAGSTRLAMEESLVEDILVDMPARDSIRVGATAMDADGVETVTCVAILDAAGSIDSVEMAVDGAPDRYRTVRHLNLAGFSTADPEAKVRIVISVVDKIGEVTTWPPAPFLVYPNRTSRVAIDSIALVGDISAKLDVTLHNYGSALSDSLVVTAWLDDESGMVALDDEATRPLAGSIGGRSEDNAGTILQKPTRGEAADETAASPVRTAARVTIALPDTVVLGQDPPHRVLVTLRESGSVGNADSAWFTIPRNIAAYDPDVSGISPSIRVAGGYTMSVTQGGMTGKGLVRLVSLPAPGAASQPDIEVLSSVAARMEWTEWMQPATDRPVILKFTMDSPDSSQREAMVGDRFRLARWNPDHGQWEVLPDAAHEWAPDTSWVSAGVALEGTYAPLKVDDRTPPTVELTAAGQHFSDESYVGPGTRFLALIEDRNGIGTAPGDIEAWIDTMALPATNVIVPTQGEPTAAMPVMIVPPDLMPREAPYVLRLAVHDVAGNRTERVVRFRIAGAGEDLLMFHGTFPNPFGADGTVLAWDFTRQVLKVQFSIYDIAGRLVVRFSNYDLTQLYPGADRAPHIDPEGYLKDRNQNEIVGWSYHELRWMGLDGGGRPLPNGVYFGIVEVHSEDGRDQTETFKMVKTE